MAQMDRDRAKKLRKQMGIGEQPRYGEPVVPVPVTEPTVETAPEPVEEQSTTDSIQQLQQSGLGFMQAVESGDPNQPQTRDRLDFLIEQSRKLAENPQFQRGAPPDTRQTVQEAIDRARSLYQERANKNEWLEVAQMLGRAVAQWGAAQEGLRTGRDMSGLNLGPGIDYGARTDRAFREYQEDIRQAERGAGRESEQFEEEARGRKEEDGKRREHLDLQKQIELQRIRDREDTDRMSNQEKKLELSELNARQRELQKQLEARQTLFNQLQQEEELTSKSARKLQEKYGTTAAKGDIDLAELGQQLEATDKPGRFFGTNPDPEARANLLKDKTNEIRNLLQAIQKRKQQLGVSAPLSEQKSAQESAPSMVQMRAPDGSIGEVPADKVAEAEKAGFTRVQ